MIAYPIFLFNNIIIFQGGNYEKGLPKCQQYSNECASSIYNPLFTYYFCQLTTMSRHNCQFVHPWTGRPSPRSKFEVRKSPPPLPWPRLVTCISPCTHLDVHSYFTHIELTKICPSSGRKPFVLANLTQLSRAENSHYYTFIVQSLVVVVEFCSCWRDLLLLIETCSCCRDMLLLIKTCCITFINFIQQELHYCLHLHSRFAFPPPSLDEVSPINMYPWPLLGQCWVQHVVLM